MRPTMKPTKLLIIALATFTLAACEQTWQGIQDDLGNINTSSWDLPKLNNNDPQADLFAKSGNCPQVNVVEELSTVSEFSDANNPGTYNLISASRITKAKDTCEFNGKTATVDIKLVFDGKTGPKAFGTNSYSYPFFVAITAPNGNILAKEVFSAPLNYRPGDTSTTHSESLRQIIPIANEVDGPKYKILIGFQLTQEQLAYNRTIIAQREADAAAAAALQQRAAQQPQQVVTPTPLQPADTRATINTQEITKPIIIRNPEGADAPITIVP